MILDLGQKPLNILWISEVFPDPNSGAGGTELLMVEHLRALGHRVDCFWAPEIKRRIQHGNLHYAFELPSSYWRIVKANLQKTNYDVVTVNLAQGYLAAKRLRRKKFSGIFVARSHGLDDHFDHVLASWERRITPNHRPIYKRILSTGISKILHRQMHLITQYCDGYCVSNSLDGRWLQEVHGLDESMIANIPQAPAAEFVSRPALPMTGERLSRLLYVANFHFAKGPKTVADAAIQAFQDCDRTGLTWICKTSDHDRVRQLFPEKWRDRVQLLGWMPQQELVKEFDRHGIFLYPSLFDGFGKVFLEAMARGCCVIGTRAGGMVDLIQSGQNGYHVDFANASAIPPLVRHLQTHLAHAVAVSTAAACTARLRSWRTVGCDLESFFQKRLSVKLMTK